MNNHFNSSSFENIPRSHSYERGKFGRLFPWLPIQSIDNDSARENMDFLAKNLIKNKSNAIQAAGFTYLGQFIAHDLSFDATSISERQIDPEMLWNFRTPALDLDSLYGAGPQANPYLYTLKDGKIIFYLEERAGLNGTNFWDLPRNNLGIALIPDPRNDENLIISQLHTAFMLFHNELAKNTPVESTKEAHFEKVQQMVRWNYQYIIYHEFLRCFCSEDDILQAFQQRRYYTWRNEPFIPVEFSGAVLRFGHSAVRERYTLNTTGNSNNDAVFGRLFSAHKEEIDLIGGKKPKTFIDWQLFFNENPANVLHEINVKLNKELNKLPDIAPGNSESNLAYRNLVRGLKLQLPSGESIAQAMQKQVLEYKDFSSQLTENKPEFEFIKGNTPLWLYILMEAFHFNKTNRTPSNKLGPVGSLIMAEVITGLLQGDKNSYLTQHPNWEPRFKTMKELLEFTGIYRGALVNVSPSDQT